MEQHLSTRGLRMMHAGIARAMADDDARQPADRQYGVRHYPDWRQQGDRIEAELAARKEVFSPLPW